MKHIAHTWRLLPVCIGLLAVACEPANLYEQIADGPVFRVTGIDDTATKAAAEISGDTFTLPGLSGDVLTAAGDTLRMRVHETAMTGMVRGTGPATKATPLTGTAFPDTLSFGLLACTYDNAGDAPSEWSYRHDVARTDRDNARSTPSSGKWVPVAASRLTWPGSGFVRYFAYAPFTDANNDNTDDLTVTSPVTLKVNATDGAEPSLEYTVPDDVSGQVDLLVATPRSTREYDGDPGYTAIDIPMTFCHALTGVRFRVGAGLTIDSVAVSGVYNSGRLGLAASPAWTNDGGTASYTIKNPGLTPDPDDGDFQLAELASTMLLLPQTLPAGATITATVLTGNPAVSYTVTADISGQVWRPGTMVIYTITDTDLSWVFEIIDETTGKPIADSIPYDPATALHPLKIVSYSSVNFGGVATSLTAQPWVVEVKNGSDWIAIPDTLWIDFMDGTAVSTGGSGVADATLSEIRQLDIQGSILDSATVSIPAGVGDADRIELLRDRSTLLSSTSRENPRDLSRYNIYGERYSSSQKVPGINVDGPHTSNCYIVSEPGWYCFPLVYGNAIDATRGGTGYDNSTAYGRSLAASERSKWFFDSYGREITSPYISGRYGSPVANDLTKYDAVVIWQDVKSGYEVIKDANIEIVPSSAIAIPEGNSLPQAAYIRFKIEKGDINKVNQQKHPGYLGGSKAGILPCNIVIGLRDTTHRDDPFTKDGSRNGPHILWSWHIWVTPVTGSSETDSDFEISEIKYRKTRNSPTDLGTVQILNTVLGWTPPLYFYGGGNVEERLTQIRFRQTAAGGKSKIITVSQGGASTSDESGGMTYQGTFYQWGRKDPLIAGRASDLENRRNRVFSSEKGYVPVGSTEDQLHATAITDRGTEIRYPYLYLSDKNFRHDLRVAHTGYSDSLRALNDLVCPLWNINGNYSSTSMNATVKTVFDPCPAGFCVPFNNAFSGFYLDDQTYGVLDESKPYAKGWLFTSNADLSSYTVFFPYNGWRSNDRDGMYRFRSPGEASYEGPWLSSIEAFRYGEIQFRRGPVHVTMNENAVSVGVNQVSRGNVVRPIVEQLPASSTSGSTEGYGSGTAPF